MDVVFDIGNVLLRWDPRFLYPQGVRRRGAHGAFPRDRLFVELDPVARRPRRLRNGDRAARARHFPDYAEELRLFDTRWLETLGGPIDDNVAIVERLKAQGRPVYALTNYPKHKFELTRPVYPILDRFDEIVVSGREGVTKPDPRIYEILFERAGRKPEDLLFIDDAPRNIEAARTLGMDTILYAPGVDLEAELIAREILRA